jgi:peptide/nickel transport system permease protein
MSAAAVIWRATRRSGRVWLGGSIVALLVVCALAAPWIAPHNPADSDLIRTLLPPAWAEGGDPAFLFGTDNLGRDILSHLIYGCRTALYVALIAAPCTMLLGGFLGIVAGFAGGLTDRIITGIVDIWMSFPPVILSMLLMIGFGIGINNVVLAIVLVDWTRFCRVVRAEAMTVAKREYVAAARLMGYSTARIVRTEILPGVMPLMITLLTLEMAIAVIVEAVLSFVGVGVEPTLSAWGLMISDARGYLYQSPWAMALPVVAIFVAVFAFNLLGDGLRRTLDPRQLERMDA